MGGKEIGEPSQTQMGEGRTTRGRGKNLKARLAWCEVRSQECLGMPIRDIGRKQGAQVQRLVPSQTPITAQGQQLSELDGALEPPVATGRKNVNYSREKVPKITPGVGQVSGADLIRRKKRCGSQGHDLGCLRGHGAGQESPGMVLHILSLISEQDRTNLKGRYPWLSSIGGNCTIREQAGVKSKTGKHSDLCQAREQEAGAGGAKGRLTTLAAGWSEQILGRGEVAEKGPLNDRAKGRRPRSGAGARKDSFRSEKDRTEYISTSSSATTSIQGCEVKAQLRSEKATKGAHENQGLGGHGFKKTKGGCPGLKSCGGSTSTSGEEQGLGHGLKKTRGGGSGVKSAVENAGEEQSPVLGNKKTRSGGLGVKPSVESTGEEQGLGHKFKKTRGGNPGVKSPGERPSPTGEEQGLGPGYKKNRNGGPTAKSGVENAGPSGEEQGLGLGYKKTRGGGPAVKSAVENPGPNEEEQQEAEDQPFPDQQTEEKSELIEKESTDPDNMEQPETPSSQEVQGPQIIWMSPQRAEENSEQFEDNILDQNFQLSSKNEEGTPLLLIPLPLEKLSSDSSYIQSSPTPMQPEGGEDAPKAQLMQSPPVLPLHLPGDLDLPEKDNMKEGTDEEWKEEEEESFPTWQLQAWGTTSWKAIVSNSTQASSSSLVPSDPEKNCKKTELPQNLDRPNSKPRPMTASSGRRLDSSAQPLSSNTYRKDSKSPPITSSFKEWKGDILSQKQEEAFREYFKFFCGPGEIDIHCLKTTLSLVGIPRTQDEMADALTSADVNGDGHVDFKDFLYVLTDTHRFCRSVEQNNSPLSNVRNPHTLLFEILSQLVEMLALPEASMEEITNYYQKKMKFMSKYKEHAVNGTRPSHPHKRAFSRTSDMSPQEQKVLNVMDRIKRQNQPFLQSPYAAQGISYSLCPRLDKKAARRRQGSHIVLEEYKPIDMTTDFRTFFQMGSKGGRELNPTLRKWLVPICTHCWEPLALFHTSD
ncbi:spermatogenesis-associated protein 21 isoform X3 [Macrotis lagotis]|uniref:spermatogenesis-associated protein 21 isoform X3 n=1 Tax=Macrotis lagotis TaxID=92651 RepID=UPI003D69A1A8